MDPTGLHYINIPYKNNSSSCLRISSHGNKKIVVMLPGRTLPADAFFNVSMDDAPTLADRLVSLEYDIAFFDPVGFGESLGFVNEFCFRDKLAEQLVDAISLLEQTYEKIFVQGFCTTYAIPLMAAQVKKSINGILLMSPIAIKIEDSFNQTYQAHIEHRKDFTESSFFRSATIEWLQKHHDHSDNEICRLSNSSARPIKIVTWGERVEKYLKKLNKFKNIVGWIASEDMVMDPYIFPVLVDVYGWDINKIDCPISIIYGEFDFEFATCDGYKVNERVKPNLVSCVEVKGAGHFGMWDNIYQTWNDQFIQSIKDLDQ